MYNKEYDLAIEAAKKAGLFLKNNYNLKVDSKIGKDIKLLSDKKSEEIILDILKASKIPIISEECGRLEREEKEELWIIDPLDGTANYWKGIRELSCVSIALWKNGEPILGVVNRFCQEEIFSGIVGKGAWVNGIPIQTSQATRVSDAILSTGFPVKRDYREESLSKFICQIQNFKKVRMFGAAAIMGTFVAAGKMDAYIEEQIMLWDIAASSAIVKAAGGVVDIEIMENQQCNCQLFANEELYKEYKRLKG